MSKFSRLTASLLSSLALMPATQAKSEPPSLDATRTDSPPEINGDLNDPAWKTASKIELQAYPDGGPAKERTTAYLLYDNQRFYVAFDCAISNPAEAMKIIDKQDGPFGGDNMELFIDPGRSGVYTHIAISPKGQLFFAGQPEGDKKIKHAAIIGKDKWQAELAIPFSILTMPQKEYMGTDWGVNFCRGNFKLNTPAVWALTGSSFHNPIQFGRLKGLTVDCDAIRMAQQAEAEKLKSGLKLLSVKTFYTMPENAVFEARLAASESVAGKKLGIEIADETGASVWKTDVSPIGFANKITSKALPAGKYTATAKLTKDGIVEFESQKWFRVVSPRPAPRPAGDKKRGDAPGRQAVLHD